QRAQVLAALPSTMRELWRVTKAPRDAAWPETARRQRVMAAVGVLGGATFLHSGSMLVLGCSSPMLVLASWFTAATLGLIALSHVPDVVRVRGPPALARVVAAAAWLSTAVLPGVLALAWAAGTTAAMAVAGAAIGAAALFTVRGATAEPGHAGRFAHQIRAVGSRLGRVAEFTVVVLALLGPLAVGPTGSARTVPVAAAPATSVAAAPGAGGVHVERPQRIKVQHGDTLTRIARGLGVSVDSLARANGKRFPTAASRHHIRAPERLRIPARWNGTWTVQPEDNLTRIAEGLGLEVD